MILVVGSTGVLGGMITRRLLEQGHRVRILVRSGSDYRRLVEQGAEAVTGDLKQPESLEAACRGVDTVITTANSALRGGPDSVETVDRQGNHNLIDAARSAGIRHFVFISALGVSEDNPMPFMRAKAETERHLRDCGLRYTILQPNIFMDIWIPILVGSAVQAGRPVTLVGEGRRRHSLIYSGDVAEFAVACLENEKAANRIIPLGGPEAVSWRDIVAACERAVGHPLELRHVEPGEPLPGMPDVVAGFAAWMDNYDSPLDTRETAAAFGVRLTPVEEYAAELFARVSA
jgi:uncharacterized protein YbjT (DUF2867 family)